MSTWLTSPRRDGWLSLPRCGCCGSERWAPAGEAQGVGLRRCLGCGTLRFEAVAPPDVVYTDGYHDGSHDFGWKYTDADLLDYKFALADRRMAWIERHRSPGRLLDVGGGAGDFAAVAQRRGWDSTLLEPVPGAVEHARKEFGVDAICAGIEEMGRLEETYDVVSLVHTLEHFPEALERLRQIRPFLAPGGLLFVEVPNHRSVTRRLVGERWLGWRAGEHVYMFTRRTLSALLRKAGYEVVARRSMVPGWHGLGPTTYAHFLGIEGLLGRVVGRRHRKLRSRPADAEGAVWEPPSPVPIAQTRGLRRAVYGAGFDALARLEEAAGLGSNLLVLARPTP